ncbi:hypothetical protein ACFC3F_06640 [Microbacterium sp. NPDC055910]|uniref:hypothetical protein n=1 Tax=Microbacterium sp. NPDC055910 TaxID=3345659 RepID=UPI0035D58894
MSIPDTMPARAKVAALSRSRSRTDPALTTARRDLAAANIAAAIDRALADAPALSDEQAEALAARLRGSAA